MSQPEVKVEEFFLEEPSRWGTVKKQSGFCRVMVNGVQGGWVPSDEKDPNHTVFHPLSGFPQELCADVCQASSGRLTTSLKAPKPSVNPSPENDVD